MPSCDPGPGPACLPAKTFRSYLPRCHRTYSCVHCRAHLAKHDELISKVRRAGLPPPGLASPGRGHAACPLLRGPRRRGQGPPSGHCLSCLHSPSKGATAGPTCLTPCESTSLLVRVCLRACLMLLCGEGGSHRKVALHSALPPLLQRGSGAPTAVLLWGVWAEVASRLEEEGPGTSPKGAGC